MRARTPPPRNALLTRLARLHVRRRISVSYGGWNNTPLEKFDKFAKEPISAWHVSDGTLSDGSAPDGVPGDLWKKTLRDMTDIGGPKLSHPTWKSANEASPELYRMPKMMRMGTAGDNLGPNFYSM